ncbi:MAG: response regulator transcription factor [Nocardioides sp.]
MTTRILIVDDQAMVRTGLASIVAGEPDLEVVGLAANGAEAIAEVRRTEPDVVLMDIRMPVMDGLEATTQLTDGGFPGRVLVLTTFDVDEYVYSALRAGASGFLLKDAPAEELIAAIRIVARGDALLSPALTRRVVEEFARLPRHNVTPAPELAALTPRERDVLEELARGKSNAEIATALVVSETTVKTHVGHILLKLNLRDRIQAVVFAYEAGVIRPGQSEPRLP